MKTLLGVLLLGALPALAQTNLPEPKLGSFLKLSSEKQEALLDAMEFLRTKTITSERSNHFFTFFVCLENSIDLLGASNQLGARYEAQQKRIAAINEELSRTNLGPVAFTDHHRLVVADVDIVSTSLDEAKYKVRKGIGGGYVKLNLLPPDLQSKLGYAPDLAIGKEFFMFVEKRWEAEAKEQAQAQSLVPAKREMPASVVAEIRAKADKDWPFDYRMQQNAIKEETEAWHRLNPK